jgi:hypothetical protein
VVVDKVNQFEEHLDAYMASGYNEAQLRIDFINPLLKALGWDVDNEEGRAEAYREVVYEDALKIGDGAKAPDYGFYIGGRAAGGGRKFFLEAKRPSVAIRLEPKPTFQLRRYAYTADLPLSILTNFRDLLVLDTRRKPNAAEKKVTGVILALNYTEYLERWPEIATVFSRDAVLRGSFDKFVQAKRTKATEPLGEAFLKDIEGWRSLLAREIAKSNPALSVGDLNFAVQRTIDRILFLRICEDRGIEPRHRLLSVTNGTNVYEQLTAIFREADDRYNSGIFHFPASGKRPDPDRTEEPDALTLDLAIDDGPLKSIIRGLYDQNHLYTTYAFSVIAPDILGQVYEQFLGKVITLTPRGHRVGIEEKPEVRKAGGVYYTPGYVVKYVVEETVGRVLKGKTPKEAEKIRVLDPASGSGSFLIGAYQYLLDWHLRWYVDNDPDAHCEGRDPALTRKLAPSFEGERKAAGKGERYEYRISTHKRREILLNSIYGVDIDSQAVEVTKLSLLLKVLEGESQESLSAQMRFLHQRALPDLGKNIKCGNSLIGNDFDDLAMTEDERRRLNKFEWWEAFPEVHKRGGFDAVVGNPPYLFITEVPKPHRAYYEGKYHGVDYRFDLYGAFIEKSLSLLRRQGKFGFIIPHTLLSNDSFGSLRKILAKEVHLYHVLDFGPGVFQGAKNETMLLFFAKEGADSNAVVDVVRSGPKLFPAFKQRFSPRQKEWAKEDGSPWLVHGSEDAGVLLRRMDTAKLRLGDLCTINQGCRTGDNAKYLADHAKTSVWKPAAGGKDIGRYEPIVVESYVYYKPDVLDAPRRPEIFFNGDKLIVQEVRNIALSRRIVATMDRNEVVGLQSTNVINRRPECPVDLSYILGVLNSTAVNVYFRFRFPGNNHIPSNQLARIPIPEADRASHERIAKLVDRLLDLREQHAKVRAPNEKERLAREAESTDRRIDAEVNRLYGITEGESRVFAEEGGPSASESAEEE